MSDEPKKKKSKSRKNKSVYNPPDELTRPAKKKKLTVQSIRIDCEICQREIMFLEEADEVMGGFAHHDCRIDHYLRMSRANRIARRIAEVDSTLFD
jgi:hypothetical protein